LISFFETSSLQVKNTSVNITAIIMFIVSLLLLRIHKLNPIIVIIIAGVTGLLFY